MYKLPEWEKRSYLFMGKPGTKKTLTLRTFMPQEYKDNVNQDGEAEDWGYIYACDRKKDGGMAVLRGVQGIEYDVFVDRAIRPIVSVKRPRKVEPREPVSIENFVNKVYDHDQLIEKGEFPYYLVALDTITGLVTGLFEEIMYKKRIDDPEATADVLAQLRPSLYEIGDAQWYVMDYIKAILQFPCISVVVAHTAFNKDSDGEIRMFPKLPGQAINDDFLSLFDEVYYFEQKRGETEVMVRTQGTMTIPARTSQPALDTFEPPDYQVWRKKLEDYYGNEGDTTNQSTGASSQLTV